MVGFRLSRAVLLVAAGLCLVQSSAASCLDCWPGLVPLTLSKLGYPQFLPNTGSGPSASSDPRTRQWVSSADSLMKKRGLADADKAAELYRKALAVFPSDIDLQIKAADAINCGMRKRTNANTILIEGGLDTPSNKKIWARDGPEALKLATAAYKAKPGDIRALAVYADSYMFATSSKGILSQAATGAGNEFKRVAKELIAKAPKHDSGVGYALLGAFYAVAPWPVGSLPEAAKNMDSAVKVSPSRRNLYYVGVVAYKRKEWQKAVDAFSRGARARCGSETEEDFGKFMLERCIEGLQLSKKKLSEASAGKK